MSKKLQKGSKYEQFDLDGDGVVTDKELARSEHMIRLENSDKMQDQQRMLCWVSSISSIILIVLVMSPVIQMHELKWLRLYFRHMLWQI